MAASPELTRVVADLRRLKALLAGAPARPAPAGFVAEVLAALDAPPRLAPGTAAGSGGGPADSRIDAEWERIELERLADEIAEAREDAAVAETTTEPRRPWPWMTMLAALAAGLLVASFVNMPPLHSVLVEKDRDVALRGAGHPQEGLSRTVDEFFAESDGDGAAEAKPAYARSDERSAAKRNPDLAADDLVKKAAPVAAAPAAENMQDEYGLAAGADQTRKEALAESTESQSTTRKGAAMPGSPTPGSGDLAASTRAAEGGGGGGGGGTDPRSREDLPESLGNRRDTTAPVVVVVRGPEGRAEFSALLAARNIGFTRRPAEKMRELLAEKASTKPGALSASAEGERREAGKADDLERNGLPEAPQTAFAARAAVESMSGTEEVIAISGSPAAIGELLAFLEAGRGNDLDLKVKGRAEALKRLARDEAKQDVAVDKVAAERARGAGGPAGETLDRNAVDGEKLARPAAKVATAAEATVMTMLVRLVDVGPATAAAKPAGPTAAAEPAAPAAGEAQGAGERQTP
ncbi:hypothetical protein LBMAG47_04920 [Planctomycetia bacterium]|nr:hypothetical protein LBMAG47_04920 [Planctomycetia bacterium]